MGLAEGRETREDVALAPGPDIPAPGISVEQAPARGRIGILRPLKSRDFAFLWTGVTISLFGDGIYLVAIVSQVLSLSNTQTALSAVIFAVTLPQSVFSLLTGAVLDRLDKRRVLIAADLIRMAAIGGMGVLSIAGVIELWHLLALGALYGVGEAFFMPAFQSFIPDLVPQDSLVEANSLNQFARPFAFRFVGPALGGLIVGFLGPGRGFLVDAATFGISAVAVFLIKKRPEARAAEEASRSAVSEIKEGFRFVKSERWLWASIVAAALGLLAFWGPFEVVVPHVIENQLEADLAAVFGAVLSAGGVGAILAAILLGQRGLPKRPFLVVYLCWSIGTLLLVGFAMARETWQLMIISFFMFGLFSAGIIVWSTLMHKLVPSGLLGRVSAFDFALSMSLLPVSFALTGPLAEALGNNRVLIGAGLLGAVLIVLFLLVPGVRDAERDPRLAAPPVPAS
jgi:DHA3 family tetracycline resistance protein-like MFS transporter